MHIYEFEVSLKYGNPSSGIRPFDIDMITTLRKHEQVPSSLKPQITIYASDSHPYLSSYVSFDDPRRVGNCVSPQYCEDLKECFRTIIRAFNIKDDVYDLEVKYHPYVHKMIY